MKSITQKKVSTEELSKIVRHHFPDDQIQSVKLLDDGWYSVAYDIELLNHNIIVKFEIPDRRYAQRYEKHCFETEVAAYQLLKGHPTGKEIPIPELLEYDLEGTIIGRRYLITRKFRGKNLNSIHDQLSYKEISNIREQIFNYQQKINSVENGVFGQIFPLPETGQVVEHSDFLIRADSWYETFSRLFLSLWEDAHSFDVKMPMSLQEIKHLLQRNKSTLNQVTQPVMVHWDLWDGNIFVIKQNGNWKVEGIIDFERALWADPLMEVFYRKAISSTTVNLSDVEIERTALYDIYLGLIMHIEPEVRQYDEETTVGFKNYAKKYWKPALEYLLSRE